MPSTLTDLSEWSRQWSVPEERASRIRDTVQRQLFHAFNSARTHEKTGTIMVRPQNLTVPGAVGLYLLEQMGADLTPLPEELQFLITGTTCQHRMELRPREGELPGIAYYDGRFMYAACCQGLGVAGGRYRRVEAEDITPEERGRARVAFVPPADWRHVGLLAVPDPEGEGWLWPSEWRRGEYETWADLCEIRFARSQGWQVEVLEKATWPESRPLDLWADRLARLYLQARSAGDSDLAGCYRSICLHTIGRMHNLGYRTVRSVVPRDDPRATFEAVERIDAEGAHIAERQRFDKDPRWIHPEWSAAIWSRCHLRISRALLSVPPESILAVNGDAIYLAGGDEPAPWRDDGRVGSLRRKGYTAGPLTAPRNWAALRGLFGG